MKSSKHMLIFAGGLSFSVALFQAVITFSPEWSKYFGAPEVLVSNLPLLYAAGLAAAVIFGIFGLYAMSGAGYIPPLPLLRFGLLMVGICEELVFRGFMHTFISRYTKNSCAIVLISSVAFGLIHWSLGLHAVIVTSTIGAIFMIAFVRTRSLPAIMLAHFTINFIDFAGVIPKAIFKFT